MRNKGKLANTLFFLSLLCIFVICSVLVVSYQINGYKMIVNNNETVNEEHTPLAYISNKIRANDTLGSIYIDKINNEDVLVIAKENTNTYIYMYDQHLMELNATKNYAFNKSDGEALFKINSFQVSLSDKMLIFHIGVNDKVETLILNLHSLGGTL